MQHKYTHYLEIEKEVDQLYAQHLYSQALELLDIALEQFPEHQLYAAWNKIVVQRSIQDYQACLDTIAYLSRRGIGIPLQSPYYDPLRTLPGFQEIEEENNRLIALARTTAKMQYTVHVPEGYTEERRYPLFIVLHGDGPDGDIVYQSWFWEPEMMLKHDMVVVYVQSSQLWCTHSYAWLRDYAIAKQDIRDACTQVMARYAIDPDQIFMGGYSGGAIIATEIVMANDLPVKGLVALCPELKPASFTRDNLMQAMERDVRVVFMEGELKALLPDEQEMVDMFQEVGFSYQLYINPGIGHSFPEDFGEKLDQAIAYITATH